MKTSDIKLDIEKTFGKKFLLTEVAPYYPYVNGVKGEAHEGYRYTVVLADRKFEKLGVKIKGSVPLIEATAEPQECVFQGLEASIYTGKTGEINFTASASSIELVKEKK